MITQNCKLGSQATRGTLVNSVPQLKIFFLLMFTIVAIVVGSGGVSAVECDSTLSTGVCDIGSSLELVKGVYYLNASNSTRSAINITASNLVLNGNGSILIGNTTGYGIFANGRNNITIKGFTIMNYNRTLYLVEGSAGTGVNSSIINNTFTNATDYAIYLRNLDTGILVENNTINYTTQQTNTGSDIYFSNVANSIIRLNNIFNGHYRGIYLDKAGAVTGSMNNLIERNYIYNSYQNGIELTTSSNNNTIRFNTINLTGHNGINIRTFNNSVYNNLILNVDHHLIDLYSCAVGDEGSGSNNVSNNMGRDVRAGHFMYLCNSTNNFINNNTFINATQYGINIDTTSNNNFIYNNILDTVNFTYIIAQNGTNNTIRNNIFNGTNQYIYHFGSSLASYNFTFLNNHYTNSLFELLDFNLIVGGGRYNYTDLSSYFVNIDSSTNMELNLYNLSNALLYNTNGSIYGSSTISSNDGNINITLPPNNSTYILDNYQVTELTTRANDPISFTSSSPTQKIINSTLADNITATVVLDLASDTTEVRSINVVRPSGNNETITSGIAVSGSTATITLTGIEQGLTTLTLITATCTAYELLLYPIITLVLTLGLLLLCFYLMKGDLDFKDLNNWQSLTVKRVLLTVVVLVLGVSLLSVVADILAVRCTL